MPQTPNHEEREQSRLQIAAKVRGLRVARGWPQRALALQLGLSQSRLSELERGAGSFTAEQLIAVLRLFNVDLGDLLPAADPEDALQNALILHGAAHLRRVPGVLVPTRFTDPHAVVLATLTEPRPARLVTALAPLLLQRVEQLSLAALRLELRGLHREHRLGWLLESVGQALAAPPPGADLGWRRRAARLGAVITAELARFTPPDATEGAAPELFDAAIRSAASVDQVWRAQASPTARRWGMVTALQPDDFQAALWGAHDAR